MTTKTIAQMMLVGIFFLINCSSTFAFQAVEQRGVQVAPVEQVMSTFEAAPALQPCPTPAATRRALSKKPSLPAVQKAALAPIGWPDEVMWALCALVAVLSLGFMFLLGRVTAAQPQVPLVIPVQLPQQHPVPVPPRQAPQG